MKTILCADFEFYKEIYSLIPKNNPDVVMDYVEDGETALEYLSKKRYDYLITTIVMPKLDGLHVIDEIRGDSSKYGNPDICVLTGLGGDIFMEQIDKRDVYYIDRYDSDVNEIQEEITKFLNKQK